MGTEITVNLQYIDSVYNEIEQSPDHNHDLEDVCKCKDKIFEEISYAILFFEEEKTISQIEPIQVNKFLFWASNPTPPPEFV